MFNSFRMRIFHMDDRFLSNLDNQHNKKTLETSCWFPGLIYMCSEKSIISTFRLLDTPNQISICTLGYAGDDSHLFQRERKNTPSHWSNGNTNINKFTHLFFVAICYLCVWSLNVQEHKMVSKLTIWRLWMLKPMDSIYLKNCMLYMKDRLLLNLYN